MNWMQNKPKQTQSQNGRQKLLPHQYASTEDKPLP
jgi:hypothetical protein